LPPVDPCKSRARPHRRALRSAWIASGQLSVLSQRCSPDSCRGLTQALRVSERGEYLLDVVIKQTVVLHSQCCRLAVAPTASIRSSVHLRHQLHLLPCNRNVNHMAEVRARARCRHSGIVNSLRLGSPRAGTAPGSRASPSRAPIVQRQRPWRHRGRLGVTPRRARLIALDLRGGSASTPLRGQTASKHTARAARLACHRQDRDPDAHDGPSRY
jgi:hypothetical protein